MHISWFIYILRWPTSRRFPTDNHVVRMRTKVSGRMNRRGIITYLGTIILFSGSAQPLLEGWASSPAEVTVLAVWDTCQKALKRHPKIWSTTTRSRGLRGPQYGGSSIITWSARALSCLHLVPSAMCLFFCPPGAVALVWSAVEGWDFSVKLDPIGLGVGVSTEGTPSPLTSLLVGPFYQWLSSSDNSTSIWWSG
jgi:hypothetical protein